MRTDPPTDPAALSGADRARALARLSATLDACDTVIAGLAERGAVTEAFRLGARVAFARRELDILRHAASSALADPAQDRLWAELSRAADC